MTCLEIRAGIITLWYGLYTQHYNGTTWIVVRLHLQQLRLRQDVDRLEIVERRGSVVPCLGCLVRAQIALGALVLLVVPVLEMDLGPLVIVLVLCR